MTDTIPLVSVIIPTYNRAARVVKAIESVLAQTYPRVQLIVVDDGSTDHTQEAIMRIAHVEYIRLDSNQGQAAARNAGLAHAHGELIASLDSDDYWGSGFLANCVGKLVADNLDFVFANWHQAHPSGGWRDFLANDPFLKPYCQTDTEETWHILNGKQLRELYLKACPSPSSSVVMRRSSIVSGWNNLMNIGDDWCLYLDMILSKSCMAAFTLEKHWYKDIDDLNIYDGRARNEVVRLLFIDDTKIVLDRYRATLDDTERKILKKRYIAGLVEYAKHLFIRDRKVGRALATMGKAFKMNTGYTIMMMGKVFYDGCANHLTGLLPTITPDGAPKPTEINQTTLRIDR